MPTTEPGKTNKSAEGKAIAARNATTHGLFARDVVLPHLIAAPVDTIPRDEAANCQNKLEPAPADAPSCSGSLSFPKERAGGEVSCDAANCQNELENEAAPAPALSSHRLVAGEGARNEREGSLEGADAIIEVDPRTHAAFLGMNEVRRVIHAAARAQSHRNARDAEEPYF